jgi:Glycosyl hydrolases family 16
MQETFNAVTRCDAGVSLKGDAKVRLKPARRMVLALMSASLLAVSACNAQARSDEALAAPAGRLGAGSDAAALAAGPLARIDTSTMLLSFSEEFDDTFSVSSWGCTTDWIAHTPWKGDFGDAGFSDPMQGFPFTVSNSALVIEARRDASGRWMSGMLSGRDVCNSGWSQLYGYFEIRAKLPADPGFVPAFWLIGVNPTTIGTSEIDVFEFHTAYPDGFTAGIIKHPGVADLEKRNDSTRHTVEPGLLSNQYNTFGVEIDPQNTVIYFNRQEIFRTPTESEFRQPFYMLVSLAGNTSDATESTSSSVKMHVDYLRAYQRIAAP